MQNILVYAGPGVSRSSLENTIITLEQLLPKGSYNIVRADPKIVIAGDWEENTVMFAMPGGGATRFKRHLGEKGNQKIINFVKSGGIYFGPCGGAYYGGAEIRFCLDIPALAKLEDGLGFYPGVISGPMHFDDPSKFPCYLPSAVNVYKSRDDEAAGKDFPAYYNGGGYFVDADTYRDRGVSILARHCDNQRSAAVVRCAFGKGAAFLSNVHIEEARDPAWLSDPRLKPLMSDAADAARKDFFRYLLGLSGIECTPSSTLDRDSDSNTHTSARVYLRMSLPR